MLQPHQVLHLSLFYLMDKNSLSVFPHHAVTFHSDLLSIRDTFCNPAFKNYCKSICRRFNLAHHSCIQFTQYSQNTAFSKKFLPQMPHGSFWLDGFLLIHPISHTITLVLARFTFRPLLSSALFQIQNFFGSSAMVSNIKTTSSAYNISYNIPSISCS